MKCKSKEKAYAINSHEYFLSKALMLAQRNIENTIGGPFGAVIVKDNSIISTGVNSVIPIIDPTAHAEVIAIRQACADLKTIDLSDCILYTSCEPCPMCLAASMWSGIKRVYYSLTTDDAAEMGFADSKFYSAFGGRMPSEIVSLIRIEIPEALDVLELWKSKSDRLTY